MTPAAVSAAATGALSDVFGAPLRGLLLLCAGLAALLLAGAVWASLRWLVPMIPLTGWLDVGAEALASVALVLLAVLLAPIVTMIVGGVFLDVAAERVETRRFPGQPVGQGLSPPSAIAASLRLAALAIPLNVLALPLLFVPIVNILVYWTLNGFLLGREYFTLAALRYRPWEDVRALRRRHGVVIFLAGLALAAVMTVPVLNLTAPLFGIALMVRLHKAV